MYEGRINQPFGKLTYKFHIQTDRLMPPADHCIYLEVQCKHPGVLENGYMQGTAPFKAGDVVQFTCHGDFMMEGQPIISCQDNSKWSGTLPKCKSPSIINLIYKHKFVKYKNKTFVVL